jgi:hypothetical protein
MNGHDPSTDQWSLEIVPELEAMNVEIDYDVMRIDPRTWAIHGRVAYDGEVIAATFASERDAWSALSRSTAISRHARPERLPESRSFGGTR